MCRSQNVIRRIADDNVKTALLENMRKFFMPIKFCILYRSPLEIGLFRDHTICYKGVNGVVMDDYRLSQRDIIKLQHHHRKAKTKFEADRLKSIYLLGAGWNPHTVAHILDRDERTMVLLT